MGPDLCVMKSTALSVPPVQFGIKANWQQFLLLVVINAFVGGMLGLERTVLPLHAAERFGLTSQTVVLSFIAAFGLSKAVFNYFSGRWSNALGRKKLMIAGWLLALPIPFLIYFAPNWGWVVGANILLGMQQGLTWTMAVVMKIDLVGNVRRGLAVGINEFAGYVAVGLVSFLTGYLAGTAAPTPYVFYMGIGFSAMGLLLSAIFLRDTGHYVQAETRQTDLPPLAHVFLDTTLRHSSLSGITQAGLVNNLNDGMMWGLLPIVLRAHQFAPAEIGILVAVYPTVWGVSQLGTGLLSDIFSKKWLLFAGMLLQSVAILGLLVAGSFYNFLSVGVLLGLGTALVYPTFLNAISDYVPASQRAESLGVFRFWRDMGYAVGAVLTGLLADYWGINLSILAIGLLTGLSALVVAVRVRA